MSIRDEIVLTLARHEYGRVTQGTGAPSWDEATSTARLACTDAIGVLIVDVLNKHGYVPIKVQVDKQQGWRYVGKWNKGPVPE